MPAGGSCIFKRPIYIRRNLNRLNFEMMSPKDTMHPQPANFVGKGRRNFGEYMGEGTTKTIAMMCCNCPSGSSKSLSCLFKDVPFI